MLYCFDAILRICIKTQKLANKVAVKEPKGVYEVPVLIGRHNVREK